MPDPDKKPPLLERLSQLATIGRFGMGLLGFLVGGLAGFAGGQTISSERVVTETKTEMETTTETVTVTEPAPQPPAPVRVSIVDLEEAGDADHLGAFDGDYGTQSIGGRQFVDGVSMVVYADGSGIAELGIQTRGRFERISGVVGIDGDAACLETPAAVSVEDDRGATLWGPTMVDSRTRESFNVRIAGAVRIYLVQQSLGDRDGCGNSEANPAWGRVYLLRG